jgi:NAD(P)-dependent dehydrogenase (short-subunit alcohol dehydrogenase family)
MVSASSAFAQSRRNATLEDARRLQDSTLLVDQLDGSAMTEEYLAGRGGAKIVADIPLGRVSTTDEVAEVIRWLAIDAPASATGSIVDVNGASYVR